MSTSHRIASLPRSIMLFVTIMCLAVSSIAGTSLVITHTNGTVEDWSRGWTSMAILVQKFMKDGDTVRINPGKHVQSRPIMITQNDLTFSGTTNKATDTVLHFRTTNWIQISGTRIVFENLSFTDIRRSLDLSSKEITFRNCVFETASFRRVMHVVDHLNAPPAKLTIESSRFQSKDYFARNRVTPIFLRPEAYMAERDGGLLHLSLLKSQVLIKKTQFISGRAHLGGCVYIKTSGDAVTTVTLTDSLFMSCIAETDGAGAYLDIANTHANSSVSINTAEFSWNRALRNGGALHVQNIPPVDDVSSPSVDYRVLSLQLSDIEFMENLAYQGGAIHMSENSVSRLQTDPSKFMKFLRNEAVARGGALYAYSGQHFDFDMTFSSNKVGDDSTRSTLDKYTQNQSGKTPTDLKGLEYGGAIYIAASSSSSDTTLVFKANPLDPNVQNNFATSGGGIAAQHPIHITNLYSKRNTAVENGGSLFLADDAEVHQAHLFKETAQQGNGGAIHATSGSFTGRNIFIKDGSAGKLGGGLYFQGDMQAVDLSSVKIFDGSSTGGGSAIYYAPSGAASTLTLEANSLIFTNDSEQPAVVISSNSSSVTFTSNDVEYRNNGGGHLKLEGSSSIVYTSTDDYFDGSSLENAKPSVIIDAAVEKSFTRTFFDGMCSTYADAAASTIVEQCTSSAIPQHYPGGWWGASSGCSLTGSACQAPTAADTCEETRKCELDGSGKKPKTYSSEGFVLALNPKLKTTTQAPTAPPTTTPPTTTPTPPGVVTTANVCELDNKSNAYATLGEARYSTRAGCEDKGYCYVAATATTRWRCYAAEASGQNVRTPGTTCNVAPRERDTAGWRGGSTYDMCVKRGACWVPPATGEFGPSCFWGQTHGLYTTQ